MRTLVEVGEYKIGDQEIGTGKTITGLGVSFWKRVDEDGMINNYNYGFCIGREGDEIKVQNAYMD